MIVIDSSALVAILRDEPERRSFIDAIVDHGEPRLSAATYVEASMVMELRLGDRGGREIDVLIEDVGMAIAPVDQAQATIAREAFRRFGKGRHRAALNFGDCFVYALAKTLDAPVLFKGDDFAQTDIKRAL
ncbi:MAG TPA: type II toxin-antitoxin system VapC family toxin [Reyranella sp.]|nr:type II toxin-antitoxin system VapC family toxin [Reyranella sp.]